MSRIAYSMFSGDVLAALSCQRFLIAIEFVKNLRIVAAVPLIVSEG